MRLRAILGLTLALLAAAPAAFANDVLRLRINDATAEPGGLAAVVVRTYASRPAGQGQICIIARAGGGAAGGPFAELVDYRVFSKRRDAVSVAALEGTEGGQAILIEFSSASSSINKKDGPLAVLYFRVRDTAAPRRTFRLQLDPELTRLRDPQGRQILLEPRDGELTIRPVGRPFVAEAEDDELQPGERAEIGLGTFEPVGMSEGQIGLRFDSRLVDGRIRVQMRRQHGKRRFKADRSTPGLVLVKFRSGDASFNTVPGELLAVEYPTPEDARVGTLWPVWIDPALTFFLDARGDMLPFDFEDGAIVFVRD